jgi:uncharacterized 2Fe-2S/4Fe-4S cluster protein (DUF4445 family)
LGSELSLSAKEIILLPGISAFVGSDIVCGLAFLDIMNSSGSALFADIGTNGEIALWKKSEKRLLCCATAAGPCFEGARGLSGSDFVDAVALMRDSGIIDETGAMDARYAQDGFAAMRGVLINQADVREFQLAKAAVCSGIKVLCNTMGLSPSSLDVSYIAGGMGSSLSVENARKTGLLPKDLAGVRICGNTSLKGAVLSLCRESFLERCAQIAACAIAIDLGLDACFAESFTDNMVF